jgi:hypothetical protein
LGTYKSERTVLSNSCDAIAIAVNNIAVATDLSLFGFDGIKMGEGQAIYDNTKSIWDQNIVEHNEKSEAYSLYAKKYENLNTKYDFDRKRAKTVYRKDALAREKLGVSGSMPTSYQNIMGKFETLYCGFVADTELLAPMSQLLFDIEDARSGLIGINEVVDARRVYTTEQFESETSTRQKDAAMVELDNWMDDFKAVARIVFINKPDTLQLFGDTIK